MAAVFPVPLGLRRRIGTCVVKCLTCFFQCVAILAAGWAARFAVAPHAVLVVGPLQSQLVHMIGILVLFPQGRGGESLIGVAPFAGHHGV